MRIALVRPPQRDPQQWAPMGLVCLASYVKRNGHSPRIIDLDLYFRDRKPAASLFQECAREIMRQEFQVLGFSVMCATLPTTLLIAEECKRLAPHIPIVLGGPEASFEETQVLEAFPQVDIMVRGEGELTLVDLMNALENGGSLADIMGITYRDASGVRRNADRPLIRHMDELPYPDYRLLPHVEQYELVQVEAGRGCPYHCRFCSTCNMWRRRLRIKSPKRLADEMRFAHSTFRRKSVPGVVIVHDHFLSSREVVREFCSLLPDDALEWSCFSRLEPLSESLIQTVRKAGCSNIYIGVESASPEIQSRIGKNLPLSRLPQTLELLSSNGLHCTLSFVIGFPGEEEPHIDQTLELALRCRLYDSVPKIQLHCFTYLKGSELNCELKTLGENLVRRNTNISPLLTGLPEERSLVEEHPLVFSSYYCSKDDMLQEDRLWRICVLYSFLAECFPLTGLLLLQTGRSTPLAFAEELIGMFSRKGAEWKFLQEGKELFGYYTPYLEQFVAASSSRVLGEVFSHEAAFYRNSLVDSYRKSPIEKAEEDSRDQIVTRSSRPGLRVGVHVQAYDHDILSLREGFRPGKRVATDCPRKRTYVAYVPGRTAAAIALSSLSYSLLGLCNGETTVGEILSSALGPEDQTERNVGTLLDHLNSLCRWQVIDVRETGSVTGNAARAPRE